MIIMINAPFHMELLISEVKKSMNDDVILHGTIMEEIE